ncbi:MAG TPA: MarR family transcriptional regulator [Gemmatimonadaceae bacterium]|nr:MarR family transcriptional regulator [Gemmatimonadaceae bacterium]
MNDTAIKTHFSFALLHAAQAVSDQMEGALNELGLSMAKQSALSKLAEAGEPLTLSELAARLSCVRSNITQLVDRLEADGLVRRVDDASDRRSVRAELTAVGIEKQKAGAEVMVRVQDELSKKVSNADMSALENALEAFG